MLYDVNMLLPYARSRCAYKREFKSGHRLGSNKKNIDKKKAMQMRKSYYDKNNATIINLHSCYQQFRKNSNTY